MRGEARGEWLADGEGRDVGGVQEGFESDRIALSQVCETGRAASVLTAARTKGSTPEGYCHLRKVGDTEKSEASESRRNERGRRQRGRSEQQKAQHGLRRVKTARIGGWVESLQCDMWRGTAWRPGSGRGQHWIDCRLPLCPCHNATPCASSSLQLCTTTSSLYHRIRASGASAMSSPDSPTPTPTPDPTTLPSLSLPPFHLDPSLSSHPLGPSLRPLFHLSTTPTFLNHASYGAVPLPTSTYHHSLLHRAESNPDLWFRLTSYPLTRLSVLPFASLLACDPADLVFVSNATTAVNAVLLSLDLHPGDVIITPDLTYGACKLAMQRLCERSGARYEEIPISLPTTDDAVIQTVTSFLDAHKEWNIKFALWDVITSPTALVMPYTALCNLCNDRGIPSMLDAAHALGQVELHPLQSGAAWVTTNCHKWAFAPKGCALLWAHPTFSAMLHPVVTSHHLRDSFAQRFWMQGTRDDTPFIAAAAGLAFYQTVGMKRIQQYNTELADWAADYLSGEWGTPPYPLYPRSMASPFMRVIELPLPIPPQLQGADRGQYGNRLLERLMLEFDVICAFFVYQDKVYARISAQCYNGKEDYTRLNAVIQQLRATTPI